MNRTFTLCFLLYPIALPFGYVLVYTFYHYAVPDANSDLTRLSAIKESSTSYDVPQKTQQTFTPMKLSSGTWLIIGHCSSNAQDAGTYNFSVNNRTVRADNRNGGGCINAMLIVFDKETSVPLSLYQDAATTLKMKVYLQAIRIG